MNQTAGQHAPFSIEEASQEDPTEALVRILTEAKLTIDHQARELEILRAQLGVLGLVRDLIQPRQSQNYAGTAKPEGDISWSIQRHIDRAQDRLGRQEKERAAAAQAAQMAPKLNINPGSIATGPNRPHRSGPAMQPIRGIDPTMTSTTEEDLPQV